MGNLLSVGSCTDLLGVRCGSRSGFCRLCGGLGIHLRCGSSLRGGLLDAGWLDTSSLLGLLLLGRGLGELLLGSSELLFGSCKRCLGHRLVSAGCRSLRILLQLRNLRLGSLDLTLGFGLVIVCLRNRLLSRIRLVDGGKSTRLALESILRSNLLRCTTFVILRNGRNVLLKVHPLRVIVETLSRDVTGLVTSAVRKRHTF